VKPGHLSQYFTGVAMKRLSAVEANPVRSNQHEFNGVDMLKKIFGEVTGKQRFPAKFLYLSDQDDEPVVADGFLTWYDAREKHLTRTEHRLYFPTTPVSQCASEGDVLVIGRRPDASVLVVVAENGSTISNQIQWLFGFHDLTHPGFSVRSELENDQDRIEYASRVILEQLEVVMETTEETYLDEMLRRFGGQFPSTKDFSLYARSTLDDPDGALMTFMDREEILFRTMERHLIADRLTQGFDIDSFLSVSLSVQNRRKSRAGSALENHLETIFIEHGIQYSRTPVTENRAKPDFIFPGIVHYRNAFFDEEKLTMLGVKSTCKDRWRQVLAEADRIRQKHLLTLETSISENQTNEMGQKLLQLVVPKKLHETYLPQQQGWLMSVRDFLKLVRERQESPA
jgi:hypothetical protein